MFCDRVLATRPASFLLLFAALLSGCRQPSTQTGNTLSSPRKTFSIRGKIIGTDAAHVTLDGDNVPGFMEPMIMAYKLKDPSVVGELHPGDRITAKILVQQDSEGFHDPELDDIVVIGQARPDYKPPIQYHTPQRGDQVPDIHLRNQSDHSLHLDEFRGKVVLMTFIYTRCPLADFCPRMSRNFADIDKALSGDPALYDKTHLLSVSFDPTYDTPKVLRSYGGAYTGRYTQETFRHWDFAAPSEKDLPSITQFFSVGVTPGDDKTLTHSLSTILIGKDGRIISWYPTNDWSPAEVLAEIKKAAAA